MLLTTPSPYSAKVKSEWSYTSTPPVCHKWYVRGRLLSLLIGLQVILCTWAYILWMYSATLLVWHFVQRKMCAFEHYSTIHYVRYPAYVCAITASSTYIIIHVFVQLDGTLCGVLIRLTQVIDIRKFWSPCGLWDRFRASVRLGEMWCTS